MSLTVFKEHLGLIKGLGFTPITFSDCLNLSASPQEKHIVLSFDDGLLDNYENAVPILNDFGFKATFFVIPGFDNITRWVNPKTSRWSDYKKEGFTLPFPSMQKQHRMELLNLGMEIGSHTLSHPKLNKIPRKQLQTEISGSKHILEDQLGVEVSTFCYPKGRFDNDVLDSVAKAGYIGACTTIPGYYRIGSNKFECGRFLIENSSLFETMLKWSCSPNRCPGILMSAIRPFLRLKNIYL